jgi:hypothetical protein
MVDHAAAPRIVRVLVIQFFGKALPYAVEHVGFSGFQLPMQVYTFRFRPGFISAILTTAQRNGW